MANEPVLSQYYPGGPIQQLMDWIAGQGNPGTSLFSSQNLVLSGTSFLIETFASGITAGTTRTQGGATALVAEVNRIDTSTAVTAGTVSGDGVLLPASVAGLDVCIINNTSNIITVWGKGSDLINGLGSIPLPPGDVAQFECTVLGDWRFEAGVGTVGVLASQLSADNIAAAGASQGAATLLPADFNRVTSGSGLGVKLPAAISGLDVFVLNHSGGSINVYPSTGDQVDDVAANTAVSHMNGSVVLYTCYANGKWYTNGLATGYAVNPQAGSVLQTMQYADALTALTGGQATSLQLTAAINTITTCPVGGGANLPASAAGLTVVVQNNGANPLAVYPAQGASDTINGAAAATGVVLHPGSVGNFNCTVAGAWTVEPASPISAVNNTIASGSSISPTAAQFTGATDNVTLTVTGSTAVTTFNLPTAANILKALHAPTIGTSWTLTVIAGGAFTIAAPATGGGVTVSSATGGAMTNASATWREWVMTVTNVVTPAVTMVATGRTGPSV